MAQQVMMADAPTASCEPLPEQFPHKMHWFSTSGTLLEEMAPPPNPSLVLEVKVHRWTVRLPPEDSIAPPPQYPWKMFCENSQSSMVMGCRLME